jgi:hypothetical protein
MGRLERAKDNNPQWDRIKPMTKSEDLDWDLKQIGTTDMASPPPRSSGIITKPPQIGRKSGEYLD